MHWASMITVGRIVRPHGNRGGVVVAPETDFGPERFAVGRTLYRQTGDDATPLVIAASRPHDGRWVVEVAGVGSIDEAETLRDQELRIPAADVHALEPDQFYVYDLVGCTVRTTAGDSVGPVTRVELATGVPLLVVDAGRGGEVLIPFIDAICRRVSLADHAIDIDPPDGLIDLNRTGRA
jgi:16S rRNA processing protein RimM